MAATLYCGEDLGADCKSPSLVVHCEALCSTVGCLAVLSWLNCGEQNKEEYTAITKRLEMELPYLPFKAPQ